MTRDAIADIAAILHPLPTPPANAEPSEGFTAWCDEVADAQRRTAEQLRQAAEEARQDPLTASLATYLSIKEDAEEVIRHLLAYGREFVQPRPYTLDVLARAAGMSESGVRTAYTHDDVAAVAAATGAPAREWRAADPEPPLTLDELLADLQRRSADPERVTQLYDMLERDGWTPAPPASRTPGARSTRRYIVWRRTWPHGTTVTLYQEATSLATGNNVAADDPRRLYVSYATDDISDTAHALAALEQRVAARDAGQQPTPGRTNR